MNLEVARNPLIFYEVGISDCAITELSTFCLVSHTNSRKMLSIRYLVFNPFNYVRIFRVDHSENLVTERATHTQMEGILNTNIPNRNAFLCIFLKHKKLLNYMLNNSVRSFLDLLYRMFHFIFDVLEVHNIHILYYTLLKKTSLYYVFAIRILPNENRNLLIALRQVRRTTFKMF